MSTWHPQAPGSNTERFRHVPWMLCVFCWAVMFPVFNQFGTLSYPYDDQVLSTVLQKEQAGDPVNRVAISLLALTGAWLLTRKHRRLGRPSLIVIVLLAFFAWSVSSVLWSIDPSLSGRRLVSLAFVLLFCAGMSASLDSISLLLFIAAFPTISLAAGLAFEILKGNFHPFGEGYRFCGTAPHPNVEGAILSIAVIGLCWLCIYTKGNVRRWIFFATAIVGAALYLTRSRTSLLAVIVSLIFSALIILVRDRRRFVPLAVAFMCLILAAGWLVDLAMSSESLRSPVATVLHRDDDEGGPATLSGRADLWKSLLPYAAKRPILGYGFDSFWTTQRIEDVSEDQKWIIGQSHSGYMDLLLSLGLPGALLYMLLLFYCIAWSTLQFAKHRNSFGAWAAILVFLAIHNLTESINVFSSFTNLTFYMIVWRLALSQPNDENTEAPPISGVVHSQEAAKPLSIAT